MIFYAFTLNNNTLTRAFWDDYGVQFVSIYRVVTISMKNRNISHPSFSPRLRSFKNKAY